MDELSGPSWATALSIVFATSIERTDLSIENMMK
jgi:hypothetical protein